MLVVDASAAVAAAFGAVGFGVFDDPELFAPALMWSEARSALHVQRWRGEIPLEDAELALTALESCPVRRRHSSELGRRAWRIAEDLGWARTYDAEYVALASILNCPLVTIDARLRRRAASVVETIGLAEL